VFPIESLKEDAHFSQECKGLLPPDIIVTNNRTDYKTEVLENISVNPYHLLCFAALEAVTAACADPNLGEVILDQKEPEEYCSNQGGYKIPETCDLTQCKLLRILAEEVLQKEATCKEVCLPLEKMNPACHVLSSTLLQIFPLKAKGLDRSSAVNKPKEQDPGSNKTLTAATDIVEKPLDDLSKDPPPGLHKPIENQDDEKDPTLEKDPSLETTAAAADTTGETQSEVQQQEKVKTPPQVNEEEEANKGENMQDQSEEATQDQNNSDAEVYVEEESGEQVDQKLQEQAEKDAKDQAEKGAKDQADKDAKDQAEKDAKDQADKDAKDQADKDAKDQADLEAQEQLQSPADEDNKSNVDGYNIFPEKKGQHRINLSDEDTMNTGVFAEEKSNFMAYFLLIAIVCIIAYLVFHNKQKILALVLEGRRNSGSRRRSGGREYRKVDTNVEDTMDLNRESNLRQVIYWFNLNPQWSKLLIEHSD